MRVWLTPIAEPSGGRAAPGVLLLLALSAVAIAAAPLALPDGYSVVRNAISESAAQALSGAWLGRIGLLSFGLAVIGLASMRRGAWARACLWAHVAFGTCMLGTAVFSHKPWLEDVPYDALEDLLHSVAANGAGLAFALGALLRWLQRSQRLRAAGLGDLGATLAATAMPLLGQAFPQWAGLVQRGMFAIAYLWYAREALVVDGDAAAQTHERKGPTWSRGSLSVSCDPRDVDLDVVTRFLSASYWARGIHREIVERSLRGSLVFSLFDGERQVGFARVITDRATFGYLADVFVIAEYRGRGLATWMMECVAAHPDLQGLRRQMLATRDAHALYAKLGFTPLAHPDVFMERHDPDVYRR